MMRQHIILKLHQPLTHRYIPYWVDFINDKSVVIDYFNNSIDDIFYNYNLDFWITKEFKPKHGNQFAEDEVRTGLNRIYRIILQGNIDLPSNIIDHLKLNPIVEEARPAFIGQSEIPVHAIAQSVNDFFDKSRKTIYLPEAHMFTEGSPDIRVAILDTGIDLSHPELKDVVEKRADFVNLEGLDTSSFVGDFLGYDDSPDDEIGHGSHVAGIIAGKGIKMPMGVAPKIKLMAVRVLATLKQGDKKFGAGLIDNINTGIKWAVDNGADVINMSLGVKHEYGGLPHQEVVEYALSRGVTIVAAAGNDGMPERYYPGALPGVIAVGAVDEDDNVASFSNYYVEVSLVAPGTNIFSSFLNGGYAVCSGTSQAAPFVSGAVALLKSYGIENGIRLKDNQIKYILKNASDKADNKFKTDKGGYGRINLIDSLKLLQYLIK